VEEITFANITEATEMPLEALQGCELFDLKPSEHPMVFGYSSTALINRRTAAERARQEKARLVVDSNQRALEPLVVSSDQRAPTTINEHPSATPPPENYFTEENANIEPSHTSKTLSKNELINILRKTEINKYNSIYLSSEQGAWLIPERLLDQLADQYGVEKFAVLLVRAIAWLETNPSKRKPPAYMEEFLIRWCQRTKVETIEPFHSAESPKRKKRNFRDEAWDAMYN